MSDFFVPLHSILKISNNKSNCMVMTEDDITRKQHLLLAIRAAVVLNEKAELKKLVAEYRKL